MSQVATLVMGAHAHRDYWNDVAAIKVPTLIVHGSQDVIPLAMPRELARTIDGAEIRMIDGAGHFPYIEKPDQTFAAINAFLSRLGAEQKKVPFVIPQRP